MKFLFGSIPHHLHSQNIGRSLYEAQRLGLFKTSGAFNFDGPRGRIARRALGWGGLSRKVARRQVEGIPQNLFRSGWFWEGARLAVLRMGPGRLAEDFVWEMGERAFDRQCAELMHSHRYDAFFGVERGCLHALESCRALGKKGVVAVVSPHHSFHGRWVDREYEKFPELMTKEMRVLMRRAEGYNALKDREIREADFVHTNSALTTKSFVDAGVPMEKIIEVPLGAPSAVEQPFFNLGSEPVRFVYAGPVGVRKGAHYLLEAWKKTVRGDAELHFYGQVQLPWRYVQNFTSDVFFHGSVSSEELVSAYRRAAFLVFPTLCDGFGLVVLEAMAQGVPVITTPNAGAHEFIRPGENGFIVPPADAQTLADTLSRCIAEGHSRPDRRKAALETARRWTWTDFRNVLRGKLGEVLT